MMATAKARWVVPGAKNYRDMVGPRAVFDTMSLEQLGLLAQLGLRDRHTVLDVGCGCLRLGRLLMPFLRAGNYYGLEPDEKTLRDGLEAEIGLDILDVKRPTFITDELEFDLRRFGRRFDFIIASSVFMHQPLRRIRACMEASVDCLSKGGRFAASFRPGAKDFRGTRDVYPACTPYTSRTMLRTARAAGLKARIIKRPHPRRQRWMVMTNR